MIEIKNVNYAYSVTDAEGNQIRRKALEGLSMTVQSGEFVVLTGGSGCGKTTVCRLVNGLIPHYFEGELSGEVLADGQIISAQPVYETARLVGSVFQNPRSQFFNVDTTSELAFSAENQGRNPRIIREDIRRASGQLGLEALLGRSMFALSGGEKQKIACGTVAVADPQIIVLDEPSSNLDLAGIEDLKKTLAIWKSQGKTVIIAEHRLFFLRELADRVIIFRDGKILKEYAGTEFAGLDIQETRRLGLRTVNLKFLHFDKSEDTDFHGNEIALKGLRFRYPDKKHGIDIPSLILPENRIIAVTGHNGAGKSTFSRCLCGLNKKAEGTVLLHGKEIPVSGMLPHCFLIMQDVNHQLFAESVLDEVMLSVADTDEKIREEKAHRALGELDIAEFAGIHPMALSGGQKQRVAIASGIASDKEIIILDEPTSGLDYTHMKHVADVLRQLKDVGRTVIVVTHDLELIAECIDYIVHIEGGEVKEAYSIESAEKTCKV